MPTTTNYWTTYTAGDDPTREVLAVLVVSQLADDHTTGRAEIPAFGIVIENDPRATIRALDAVAREVARRYAHLNLRFGAMTLAFCKESRPLVWATDDGQVIADECYESMWTGPNKRTQDLALLSELFGDGIGAANEEGVVESGACLEEVGERVNRYAEIVPARQMHIDLAGSASRTHRQDLHPVGATVLATIEDIAHLEAIDGRRVDDDLALHDAEMAGDLPPRDALGERFLPRQRCFFFVDDVMREDPQGGVQFAPDREGPVGKVDVRIDDNDFAQIVGNPGRRVVFVNNRCLAENVGTGLPLFEDAHLVGFHVNRSDDDSALVTRRAPTGIDYDQQLAGTCRGSERVGEQRQGIVARYQLR